MTISARSTRTGLATLAAGALLAAVLSEWAGVAGPPSEAGTAVAASTSPTAPGTGEPATSSTPPSATAPRDECAEPIAALSPRQRLAQLVVVGVDPSGPAAALAAVTGEQVGGIFVGGEATGLLSGDALTAVRSAARIPLTVSVDDEGGRVQRVEALDGELPSARRMTATRTPAEVRALAAQRGRALAARGVTMNLAPIADTSPQPDGSVIGDRSFSADPAVAREYVTAFAAGLQDAGVKPVLKHFPGHGNATGDSHLALPSTPPLDALRRADLLPYRDIGDYGDVAVMLGHLDVPGLTGGEPATLSPAAYALLREEYGFTGPAMTDDLGAMKAVTDRVDLPLAVQRALAAGADLALWSSGGRLGEVLDRLEQAVASGDLPQERVTEALRRVLTFKGVC
ncbi:glycoside hydrolase family 3 N-terminal domain-containing protein [Umezawaea beigongshangensis]|uniref:glycoside hydrolase family 3 N-terminal domain-containing protein n=1 Tax=Umezawaea beigongshangensis TaxID=2780383 RepID=UPI0018F14363|nr:glycoside hydrolase family 3 N-terminal domain-containing protein [Umezawaea beigongshangensis]